jgi:hypothetical protein
LPPEAAAGRRRLHAGSAGAQHRRSAGGIHRDVAAALENAWRGQIEARAETFELLRAISVTTRRMPQPCRFRRSAESRAMGIDDGADQNAGALGSPA